MKVSLNIIKQYIDFELPAINELVARINAQLGGVEEVVDLAAKYQDAKIVKVVECEKHLNADKLSVCKIDAGTSELIQVVCGAPNVHAGMWAIWLPPASTVPATYNDSQPFVLGTREIRGVMSNGMLASSRELAIGDDHDGIVEIASNDVPEGKELNAGEDFAEVFGLNDYIIEIENKMFTHRPDLFGQVGVAREIAGILGKQFTSPDWYRSAAVFASGINDLSLEVFNDAPNQSSRFMAVVLKDVEVKPSPLWLRCALIAMGGRAVNNIVDATNYTMLVTAQPTHAYDYDKIRGKRLGVRMAREGEMLSLLNAKSYVLTSDDIVIVDGEGAIGLAGIMGGSNSEVSKDTRNIVLEVANFDMYSVRKSSMRHGIFTDASTRFNKGQSPFQNDHILNSMMKSIADTSSGKQASDVSDLGNFNVDCIFVHTDDPNFHQHSFAPQGITNSFINDRLGLNLDNEEIAKLLRNVEFKVRIDDDGLDVHYPFWRTDIQEPEDLVEEVGRLYGYDRLPLELPSRTVKPTPVNVHHKLAQLLRENLKRAGANEVLTYSFVHERVINAALQDKNDAYQLSNALSPDLQYYRVSLTPSILDKMHANTKAGYDEFALYEIGKSHCKSAGADEDGLPVELETIAFVYTNKQVKVDAPFYKAKNFVTFLADQLGLEFAYEPLSQESTSPVVSPFEAKRSAIITDKKSGKYIGIVGEYKKAVSTNFKLYDHSAGFELNLKELLLLSQGAETQYRPLSRYPSVGRDVSLKVIKDVTFSTVFESLQEALKNTNLDTSVSPIGIYQPQDATAKNLTFRISLTSNEKTLTNDEANKVIERVAQQLEVSIGSKLV